MVRFPAFPVERFVVVQGPPGVAKTLLAETAAQAGGFWSEVTWVLPLKQIMKHIIWYHMCAIIKYIMILYIYIYIYVCIFSHMFQKSSFLRFTRARWKQISPRSLKRCLFLREAAGLSFFFYQMHRDTKLHELIGERSPKLLFTLAALLETWAQQQMCLWRWSNFSKLCALFSVRFRITVFMSKENTTSTSKNCKSLGDSFQEMQWSWRSLHPRGVSWCAASLAQAEFLLGRNQLSSQE